MNEIIHDAEDFYISYLAERSEFAKLCDDLCHAMGRPEPKDLPETAICVRQEHKFYILYGDHRENYRKIAETGGLQACLKYFRDNIEHIGHSSDVPPAEH